MLRGRETRQAGALGYPTQDADGIWRHKDVQVWWRPAGSAEA